MKEKYLSFHLAKIFILAETFSLAFQHNWTTIFFYLSTFSTLSALFCTEFRTAFLNCLHLTSSCDDSSKWWSTIPWSDYPCIISMRMINVTFDYFYGVNEFRLVIVCHVLNSVTLWAWAIMNSDAVTVDLQSCE